MSQQPNNPPEFAEAEEPRRFQLPAIVRRFPLVLILTICVVLAGLIFFTRGHKTPPPGYTGARAASMERPNRIESPPPPPRALPSPTPEAEFIRAEPSPTATPTPVETVRYEPPARSPSPSPLPVRRYQVVFRAGTPDEEARTVAQPDLPEKEMAEAAPQAENDSTGQAPEAKETLLPVGTVLALKLLNPLLVVPGSGTHGRVRVTRDVIVTDELTIPAGSEGYISFVKLEGSERIITEAANPGFLKVGDTQYQLAGMVLGADQYVGLKGKREKIEGTGRPNVLKRVGGQLAQQVTGRAGIYAGDVVDIYGRGGAAQYLVKVPAGTLFTLTSGLK